MKAIWKTVGGVGLLSGLLAVTPLAQAGDRDDRREHRRDRDDVRFFVNIINDGFRFSFGNAPRCEPPPRRWIAGHYETRREKVVHPGYWQEEVTPAEYGWVKERGCKWKYVVVKPECRRRVWVPERCEWVETQVWVPGRYEERRFAWAH